MMGRNPVIAQREHEASAAYAQSPVTWSDVPHVRNAPGRDVYTGEAPELRR